MFKTEFNFRKSIFICTIIGLLSTFSAVADDNPDTPRLHPLEKFCVTSTLTGMMTGTWTECARDYAYERYELQNTTVSFGPISQSENKRVLYVGPQIYTINLDNGSSTVAVNPMFDGTVAALQNSDPMQMSTDMLGSMGFTPNGQTMDIVGYTCNVAAGPMGSICMTDDGLVLNMDTMGQVRTATSVDLDSGGIDANYVVPDNAQQAPDMSDITDMMQGLPGLGN